MNDKVGLMMRSSLAANAQNVDEVFDSQLGIARLGTRSSVGGNTSWTAGPSESGTPLWIAIERLGNVFTASVSSNGTTWTTIGSATVAMGSTIYVGMAVYSRDTALNHSTFANVAVGPALTSTGITLARSQSTTSNAIQALSFTATVTSGVPNGETVQLQDVSNGNAVVATGIVSNGSAALAIPAGAILAGTHNLITVYGGDATFAASQSNTIIQTVQVVMTNVQVNANISSLGGTQRSMVDSVVYTFSEAANVTGASAFIIVVHSGPTAGTVPTLIWTALNANFDGSSTQWAETFSGNGVVGKSIANGIYDITMTASDVTADANPIVTSQARTTDTFHRLYGDYYGNGAVNALDYSAFLGTYSLRSGSSGFIAAFDSDGNGVVNAIDYSSFLAVFIAPVFGCVLADQADALVAFSYVTGASSYSAQPGSTVAVNIYLKETLSDSNSDIIYPDGGLIAAGAAINSTLSTGSTAASFSSSSYTVASPPSRSGVSGDVCRGAVSSKRFAAGSSFLKVNRCGNPSPLWA